MQRLMRSTSNPAAGASGSSSTSKGVSSCGAGSRAGATSAAPHAPPARLWPKAIVQPALRHVLRSPLRRSRAVLPAEGCRMPGSGCSWCTPCRASHLEAASVAHSQHPQARQVGPVWDAGPLQAGEQAGGAGSGEVQAAESGAGCVGTTGRAGCKGPLCPWRAPPRRMVAPRLQPCPAGGGAGCMHRPNRRHRRGGQALQPPSPCAPTCTMLLYPSSRERRLVSCATLAGTAGRPHSRISSTCGAQDGAGPR